MGLYPGDRRAEAKENSLLRSNALKCHSVVTEFLSDYCEASGVKSPEEWDGTAVQLELRLRALASEVHALTAYAKHKGRRLHYDSMSLNTPVLACIPGHWIPQAARN